ncbi:hypothetical protein IOD16_12275 [Saccharothrix sp. 6-C]|uniref:hypothetical protein n=1 Tax=Saccharothrix sp. 6-C TaxID=2781735 RepID=UPI0019175A5F|nr:hypothetical protein [Saccharothrix sp. 6-C]QQQ79132.1 hypothetical protein IOD16_12275 [Saccharothrix sp. 6-C]
MATGTAALAPMRTVRRKIAARADVDQRIEAIGAEAAAEPDSVVGRPTGGQFPEDPFASLRGVAGWAVDYVTFLREPIDQLQGDPQSVQATVDAIRSGAERMRELASTQRDTLAKPQGWTGKAQEAYQTSMDALGGELDSLAGAVAVKGVVVENSGAMVRALREALLHTVGQYSHSLVPGAISAYVFAPITFGASIAMFLASVVDSATQLGTSIAAKMDDLNAALTRQVDRVKQLDEIADEVGRGWERFEAASSGGSEATPAHTASRRLLREGETAQEQLRPMQATRAMAVEETEALRPVQATRAMAVEEAEALRPVHAVAGERLTGRLLPEEPTHFVRAEEPVQARHAVQAEPMMRTAHVQAEPMMRTAHVQAEPMMQATRLEAPVQYEQGVRATEPATHFRAAEQAEARAVTATHHATVRRVEETE